MIKRNTIQRTLVLDAVKRVKGHATADEVYHIIVREYPNISKVTVYRNLNQLAESGEILKIEVPGGADRFDAECHKHYHARCLQCGRVFDVDMEYVEDLGRMVTDTYGFTIVGYDLMFKGFCPDCKKEASE